jgi:hypothetical protein
MGRSVTARAVTGWPSSARAMKVWKKRRIGLTMIRRKFVSPISAFPQAMSLEKRRHGSFFIGGVQGGNPKLLDRI